MKLANKIFDYIFFRPVQIDKTFWVVVLMVCAISAGAFTTYKAVRRVGKPFQNFFIGGNMMVSVSQRAAWAGVKAGLKPLDKILEVNGRKVKTVEEFKDIIWGKKKGDVITYKIERAGETRFVSVPIRELSLFDFWVCFVAPFAIGLFFLILGTVTLFYVPNLRVSYLYFIFCSLVGVFCLVYYEAYTSHTFFRIVQNYPLIAAVAVHLFSIFPNQEKISQKSIYTIISVYIVSIGLIVLRQIYLYDQDISILLSKLSSFFVGFTLLLIIALLVAAVFKAKTNVARDRAKVLIAGIIIASSAVGLWSINYIFQRASFYLDQAILISLIFPIFMSYAILKKNIFDIDRVIRTSLTYAVSTVVVLLSYFVIIATIGFLWPRFLRTETLLGVFALFGIIGAFIFKPLKVKIQTGIYKLFFREKYNRLQTLMDYGKKLSSGLNIDDISKLLVSDLVSLMDLEGAALMAYSKEESDAQVLLSKGVTIDFSSFNLNREDSKLVRLLKKYDKPQSLFDLNTPRTSKEISPLRNSGIEIIVPIKSKDDILGILFLLGKKSKDIFTSEDIEFLYVLSSQAAVALENAKLYLDQARQERLAAIGQVASVIIHEIKNPLGIIKVSAGTIKRRFDNNDHAFELATFIEQEVSRMNSTIQQILNFSKPKINRIERFNIENVVLDIAKGMEREFSSKGISLVTEIDIADKEIVADHDKIRRALINLLSNARDFVEDEGEVRVKVCRFSAKGKRKSKDKLQITVEDNGRGICEKDLKKIFNPFYTTRQEGTGLGLAIVKQIALDHDGTVAVESRKGKGTKFIISIPLNKSLKESDSKWNQYQNKEF